MEQFDQLLTCAICLDRYRNPKLLPCQHSFCMEPCMEGLINYVTRQVKCPECRAEHRIPYQGIAAYPTNVTLQRFLELHIEITGELPDPTSGQVMERCGVCSEKSYCTPCCHCDKKICPDCKESHLDILRREIARVNNQVRRTLPRLQDALGVIDKNTMQLQQNCTNIIEEVDGIYLRLSKALKDRTDAIKSEIEVFMAKEMKGLTGLRANLEQEISNFDSNSEFAEKHVNAEGGPPAVPWDDNELMDTKDIFLRTMEFIRNFESEPGDYHRRVRFFIPQDPNQLANTLSNLGELTINYSQKSEPSMYPLSQPPSAPSLGPGLMRSKSDHRVAAQFRQAEERYLAYGSDNNDDTTSSRQRYFGERHNTGRTSDRYGRDSDSRRGDYDYDDSPAETSRRPSRFRSRFMRHHDSGDSDNEPSSRSVRFNEGQSDVTAMAKKERQRVLDTEDAARGPLSGITRLADSPRVIKRIQEVETKGRRKDSQGTKPTPPTTLNLSATAQPVQQNSPRGPQRVTGRQVSEEDEISKIKKQNKSQEASQQAAAETTGRKPDSSVPSTPTSNAPSRMQSGMEQRTPSRQTSTTSEASRESSSSTVTPTGDDGRKRSMPSKNGATEPVPDSRSSSNYPSNTSPTTEEASGSERTGRKVGRVSVDRFNKSASSESSTSAESSTHSSPVRNTGAAFSTVELKNRFSRKNSTGSNGESGTPTVTSAAAAPATMATTTTRSRFGNVSSSPATTSSGPSSSSAPSSRYGSSAAPSTTSSSNGAAAANAPHRFQSRFLGRAGTPTAEASRGSENSQSSSSDDSSDSSESDSAPPPSKPAASSGKDRELARTDIGPLLARSAQARDSYPSSNASSSTRQPESPSSYTARSRANAAAASAASSTANSVPTGRAYGSAARYGTDGAGHSAAGGSASSIARSRTGSSLSEDLENKYPLTSKYLNRSRANMADPAESTSSSSYGGGSSAPRYGSSRGYQSRFLNKSKSSAALASEGKDADGEDEADGDDAEEVESSSTAPSQQQQQPLLVSGEERYPSGRSRYAALKDRRSRLARSKSSHEVVPDGSSSEGPSSSRKNIGQQGAEVGDTGTSSQEPTSPPAEAGSGSSLSTWARYLKNKYGPRNKETSGEGDNQTAVAFGGNRQQQAQQHQQRFSRSRSIGSSSPANSNNVNNNNGYWTAEENKDSSNSLITSPSRHQYMQKRKIIMKFGTRGSEPGCFTWPRGVAVGPDNSIVVADSSNHRVQVFDMNGHFRFEFGYYGNGEGEFDCLAGVTINRIGQYIIADRYNHRIQVFDPSGRFLRFFGSHGSSDGKLSYPWGVTTDALGFIYVCDKENHRVQVFQSDGTVVGTIGSYGNKQGQLDHPHYIAVSCTNRVIVSDSNNHRIQIFDINGKVQKTFGKEGSEEGQFKFPRGVAVDDQGYIIVADSGNNRIQIFSSDGLFISSFGCWGSGDGEFKGLEGIAVLPNGNIVVCDRENHRIQVF